MSKKQLMAIALCAVVVLGITGVVATLGLFPLNNNNNNKNSVLSAEGEVNKNIRANVKREFTLIAEDAQLQIAPGEVVKTWTFNGTMPGPTLRFTEGDNVTIHFINKSPIAHTVHTFMETMMTRLME